MIAILYTGQTRTIRQTLRYFKDNVLLNDDVHVFVTIHLQSTDSQDEIKQLLNTSMGNHVKAVCYFDPSDPVYLNTSTRLLNLINTDQYWKNYLKNGGSMMEYYQLYLSYINMVDYEHKHNIEYEYVVRIRTDVVLSQPLDFKWLQLSDQDIQNRYQIIVNKTKITDPDQVNGLIMNTLTNWNRLDSLDLTYIYNHYYQQPLTRITSQYIKDGRYILTFRRNVAYIVNRRYFHLIPSLIMLYGTLYYRGNQLDQRFWFNAENQFMAICIQSGLDIFDSLTPYENQSLVNYNSSLYLDNQGKLINSNTYAFFIMRNSGVK